MNDKEFTNLFLLLLNKKQKGTTNYKQLYRNCVNEYNAIKAEKQIKHRQ